ncbi:MAG: sulfite exporter TauE/SafE family protein [Deltaproteobacteria bacterium]|nr:sulfite exporter TauE/SafE family protein [Deltaproteobacteria bacterium]
MIALLGSVLVASVVGSLHCVGMCGPLLGLVTAPAGRVRLPVAGAIRGAVAHGLGRGLGYALLGMLAGSLGMAIDLGGARVGLQRTAVIMAGGSMILIGVVGLLHAAGVRSRWRPRFPLATAMVSWVVRRSAATTPRLRGLGLGMATVLIPCGWLHVFVITAAGTGSPGAGAAVMVAFWLGTMPAMLVFGASIQRLGGRVRAQLPWAMSTIAIAVGVYTLTMRTVVDPEPGRASTGEADVPLSERGAPCH